MVKRDWPIPSFSICSCSIEARSQSDDLGNSKDNDLFNGCADALGIMIAHTFNLYTFFVIVQASGAYDRFI